MFDFYTKISPDNHLPKRSPCQVPPFFLYLENIFQIYFSKMQSETFGERIRHLRTAQNMSLRELASALNYDQSSLSKIGRNELTAPVELVRPMAEKLMDLKIQLEEMLDR